MTLVRGTITYKICGEISDRQVQAKPPRSQDLVLRITKVSLPTFHFTLCSTLILWSACVFFDWH